MPNRTSSEDFTEIERFLDDIGPVWQERMGLAHVEITHHYLDADSELVLGTHPRNKPGTIRCTAGARAGGYTAFVETRWNYQLAHVYFMLPSTAKWSREQLEKILVHEYSHVLCAVEQYLLEPKLEEIAAEEEMTSVDLDALSSLYFERMEMATENVARAVWRAWQ